MYCRILLIVFALFYLPVCADEGIQNASHVDNRIDADAIMREVIKHAESYGEYVSEYDAQIYVKRVSRILKKNKIWDRLLKQLCFLCWQSSSLFSL